MAVYSDVERPRIGEGRMEGLEHVTWARQDEGEANRVFSAEATRVSTRREAAKNSLVTGGVSRLPNCTNRTQKTI